jgi:Tfp pilus assembly protein PilN
MTTLSPLWLDYQRPFPGHHWPGWLLLAMGGLLCSGLLIHSISLGDQIAATDRQVLKLKREIERQRLLAETGTPAARTSERAPHPSSLAPVRWESLLVALESAGSDSVTLLALEPGVRDVSIDGEARDFAAATDYVNRLQNANIFTDVYLARHQLVTENPYRPVRFTLLAKWREGVK